jgi:YesN/AraC family two-component response regulator
MRPAMAIEKVPDIVLSNIMMPVMDGIEMLRRIKNDIRTSHIPMIMLTAKADISSRLSGIEKGAVAYLLIPFNEIELQAVLKNLIGLRRKLQEHYVSVTLSEIIDRTEPSLDDQFMQKILCLIDANIDDDQFGISEVCDALGISRAQIYRKFKSLTDKTPHDYLRSYRLQRAKELLLKTKLNVSEVAYRTGFKNISHFSRIFAEEFGKHPSEFSR